MIKQMLLAPFLITLLIGMQSCGSNREVSRMDPEKQTDLSGKWNDTDSRMVAEEMVNSALDDSWLTRFDENFDRKPVVIVGVIKNKTHEHINPQTFIKDIEREFIDRGRIRVVEGNDFRKRIREERADQQKYASEETQKEWGKELGADYMMTGVLSSIVDSYQDEKVVSYQANLQLTNLETNEKVWIGDKKIKKYIED
jgi:uncharacterized protein (TIGR02722 family)